MFENDVCYVIQKKTRVELVICRRHTGHNSVTMWRQISQRQTCPHSKSTTQEVRSWHITHACTSTFCRFGSGSTAPIKSSTFSTLMMPCSPRPFVSSTTNRLYRVPCSSRVTPCSTVRGCCVSDPALRGKVVSLLLEKKTRRPPFEQPTPSPSSLRGIWLVLVA